MLLIPRPTILRWVLPARSVWMKVPLHCGIAEGEPTVILTLQSCRQDFRVCDPWGKFGWADLVINARGHAHSWVDARRRGARTRHR